MKRPLWLAAAILFVAGIQTSSAYELTGRVVSVADGDTVTLLDANLRQHKVRLSGIDAPERRQPFGNRSRLHLGALVFGKQVTADCPKKDRYKRGVPPRGRPNLAQIEAGMAWHYKAYAREQSPADQWRYAKAEDRAREARQGLWADRAPVAPWDFRKARKTSAR